MGPYVHPSFALFCLENLSVKTVNDILQNAHDGSTVDQWYFYLATSDYASSPQKPEGGGGQEGTEAPIDKAFKSPFVGQSVAAVAEWLKRKPKSVDLEDRFFAVLDKKAEKGLVALCRIGDRDLQGDALSCVLVKAEESSLTLAGMEYGNWEDLVQGRGEYTPRNIGSLLTVRSGALVNPVAPNPYSELPLDSTYDDATFI